VLTAKGSQKPRKVISWYESMDDTVETTNKQT